MGCGRWGYGIYMGDSIETLGVHEHGVSGVTKRLLPPSPCHPQGAAQL